MNNLSAVRVTAQRRGRANGGCDNRRTMDEEGFGLIEVIVAMVVLAVTLFALGWLIVSGLSTSEQAKQRATAASLIEQVDSLIQSNVPSMTCALATTYVASNGSGSATRNGGISVFNGPGANATNYTVTSTSSTATNHLLPVTISVSWKPAASGQPNMTSSNQLQVQCQ
jgi:prepilin-type N-terminal cleavage/methylation domain-containing protein